MAAYMKTSMPFYGVQKPHRDEIFRELKKRFTLTTARGYRAAVLGLWTGKFREEKYFAISVARAYPRSRNTFPREIFPSKGRALPHDIRAPW